MTYAYIFGALAIVEAVAILWALAMCKAAARRPLYGPPIGHCPQRREMDRGEMS